MFFVGTMRFKNLATGERIYRARLRLEDGSHRLSRRGFRQAERAAAWGRRWVQAARQWGRVAV